LFMAIGALLGGRSGMVFALAIAIAMNFFSYWFSDKLVLRMYNAHEVDEASAPQFYRIVRELAQKAGLPMPRVYLIDEDAPNAFATGRNPDQAAVAATSRPTAAVPSCRAILRHWRLPCRKSSAMRKGFRCRPPSAIRRRRR